MRSEGGPVCGAGGCGSVEGRFYQLSLLASLPIPDAWGAQIWGPRAPRRSRLALGHAHTRYCEYTSKRVMPQALSCGASRPGPSHPWVELGSTRGVV